MGFYHRLETSTANERVQLFSAPIIGRALSGEITLQDYVAFLLQAYHHVKHTTPLLMACGARLPEEKEWLREAVAEYIEEELGHQEWILNDLAACGVDKEKARRSRPAAATEIMVAYAWDTINRVNPLGFFGMVHVLEGTSIRVADEAAESIQRSLNLPNQAFSYLRSHGKLDQQHVQFFQQLMDRIVDEKEQEHILHSAKMFYLLYGNIFRTLDASQVNGLLI